ncbi:MAG TPA: S53 family peptidase [Gemmatimonadales bacterium]|jgi:kumamolisin|nr:S53 family peptidase [Gemmatimonadales bacterium]
MVVRVVLRAAPLPRHHRLAARLERLEAGATRIAPQFSAAEFAPLQAPDPDEVRQVIDYASAAGLEVVEVSGMRHDVVLAGFSDRVEAAFGVELELFDTTRGSRRSHRGAVHVPEPLHRSIVGVLGLDEIPRHRRHVMSSPSSPGLRSNYSPLELGEYYRFPPDLSGRGQRIAILAFGGGYHRTDLERFFRKVPGLAVPEITPIGVGFAGNRPLGRARLRAVMADYNRPRTTMAGLLRKHGGRAVELAKDTLEVTMDIEIAGAIASRAAIDVVFADPSASGWYDAIYTALGLGSTRCRTASVISISWGIPESAWPGHLNVIDQALRAACLKGVTVVCASGDRGSTDDSSGGAGVDFPGSSPHVLTVGGTSLRRRSRDRDLVEVVWNDRVHGLNGASGGGLSGHWRRPRYQRRVRMPRAGRNAAGLWTDLHHPPGRTRRGVPDVAAVAGFEGGYRVIVGGIETTGAGTSCGAPLWAGLAARLAEGVGRPLGWLNPSLYRSEFRTAFRDIVRGDNRIVPGAARAFRARKGWDCCSGLGTPLGIELLRVLRG